MVVLRSLYFISGAGGATCILAICALILVQIVGRQLGFYLPESDELTAWSMAGSVFLPLAWIYRAGGHIRVQLAAKQIALRVGERRAQLIVLAIGLGATLVAIAAGSDLTLDSLQFDERTPGSLGLPYALPQAIMTIGFVILAIAIVEDLLRVFRGLPQTWQSAETADVLQRAEREL